MSHWMRQVHRWLSVIFTLTVAANFGAMTFGPPPPWITYSPLPFLFLMLATGIYLFFLPYVRRGKRTTS